MLNRQINVFQACMIFSLVVGLTSHVIDNSMILNSSGRDAWIAVLFAAVFFLIWCALLKFIVQRSDQQPLLYWLKQQTGSVFAWIILVPLLLQIYLFGSVTVSYTVMWTVVNYLPETPVFAISLSLVFLSYWCARYGLNVIAICAGILLPIVIGLGIFVNIANIQHKDYSMLKPILEHGMMPVYKGMMYSAGSFAELIMLLCMQHQLKGKVRLWHLLVLATFLVIITLGPVTAAIAEFGPTEAAKQTTSPYEQWRLVTIGSSIEHLDFFSIYQWLAGAFIRMSLMIFLLAEIIQFQSKKAREWFLFIIAVSYLLVPLLPISQELFFHFLYHMYFPISLFLIILLSFIMGIIALFTKTSKEDTV
ncbi:GerAB/ArcD/ProY family transporter [Paenibacillus albiflavus]|nr:endospore germination permease [Paenibacillus albiflavus]